MSRLTPEDRATKWSLLVGYNPDSADIEPIQMEDTTKSINVANYVWDTTTLAWVRAVQNVLVTDSVYLAVDGVEALLTTIDADTGGILTSVQIMDDWDESNRCAVNLISGQAGITASAGAVAANTPRVTLASDDPAVTHLATIAGCVGADSNFYVEIAGVETEVLASSTTPLGAGSSWTSGELNVYHYSSLNIYAQANVAGTITLAFSHDGTNWRSHTYTVPAGTGFHAVRPVGYLWAKVTFNNTGGAQASFIIYVTGNPTALGNPMQRIDDDIEGDQIALLSRSVIAGETTAGGGAFVNVKVNPSGTLEVNAEQSDTVWAVQWSEGLTAINNFAAATDTDLNVLITYAEAHDTDFGDMITRLTDIRTAIQIMDDWDLNDRCRVSPISGQDGVQGAEGVITALTQRVTIATDDDLVANQQTMLTEIQDAKEDYFLDSWLVSGDTTYVASVDKGGNYMIAKFDAVNGTARYESGSGGVPGSSTWSGMTFQTYDSEY